MQHRQQYISELEGLVQEHREKIERYEGEKQLSRQENSELMEKLTQTMAELTTVTATNKHLQTQLKSTTDTTHHLQCQLH